ncbi:sugar phosphate isomerase/epimerase family protein [Paractinoplanes toevensis]|uniref:Xylose isomerase n=1 Tax=Paractinoplanes toevensis TaxID=571911 RepID=A0A919T4B8_9ACTN|nr:TIM barrel protein [Actinoplanes toevensis]GIM89109.1 xylose isomerase [Actinoplanes toevensis]
MFAVSTLGCPGLPLPQVGALLRRHGVGALQLRCAADEPVHVGLNAAARSGVRRDLRAAGLTLIGLATYVRLADGAPGLTEHLRLAQDLGAPALRLMPGGPDPLRTGPMSPVPADVFDRAAEALADAAARAAGSGVRLLVETHDAFLRGADLRRLLEAAAVRPPAVGAIWDAMHPWRAGETPAETVAALAPWLAEIQIKDAASAEDRTPLVPGTGAVPGREVLDLARAAGYAGPVVLEHEARWYPDAAPIDDAIDGALALLTRG